LQVEERNWRVKRMRALELERPLWQYSRVNERYDKGYERPTIFVIASQSFLVQQGGYIHG
jgi:hypothetical protein